MQGSELSGWALGRYSVEGIDLNHNFPDLNNILWDAQEVAAWGKTKVPNHYIPIPEYYTKEEAMVGSGFDSQCSQSTGSTMPLNKLPPNPYRLLNDAYLREIPYESLWIEVSTK